MISLGGAACYDANKAPPVEPNYPPMTPFVGDVAEACAVACDHLKAIGCPEGKGSLAGHSCAPVCVESMNLRPLPLACWANASSQDAARACGSLRCAP